MVIGGGATGDWLWSSLSPPATNHTLRRFYLPQGLGKGLHVSVHAGGQTDAATAPAPGQAKVFSYRRPAIKGVRQVQPDLQAVPGNHTFAGGYAGGAWTEPTWPALWIW